MSAAAGQVAVWLTIVVALWCAWRMRRDEQGRK
jgi:F0F1-type ATP synthase assembly protein I